MSWGPGAQGLISRVVISAWVLTGVINGCESIQAGWGPRRIATTPFHGVFTHPWVGKQPEGCRAPVCREPKGAKPRDAVSSPRGVPAGSPVGYQSRWRGGWAQHPPLPGSPRPSSGRIPRHGHGGAGSPSSRAAAVSAGDSLSRRAALCPVGSRGSQLFVLLCLFFSITVIIFYPWMGATRPCRTVACLLRPTSPFV